MSYKYSLLNDAGRKFFNQHPSNLVDNEDIIAVAYNVFECWKAGEGSKRWKHKAILQLFVPKAFLTLIVGETVEDLKSGEQYTIADLIQKNLDLGGTIQCLNSSTADFEDHINFINLKKQERKELLMYSQRQAIEKQGGK